MLRIKASALRTLSLSRLHLPCTSGGLRRISESTLENYEKVIYSAISCHGTTISSGSALKLSANACSKYILLLRDLCLHSPYCVSNVIVPQKLQVPTPEEDPGVPITELIGKFEKLVQRSAPFLPSSKTAAANDRALQKFRTYLSSVVARSKSTYELEASEERVSFVIKDARKQQLKTLSCPPEGGRRWEAARGEDFGVLVQAMWPLRHIFLGRRCAPACSRPGGESSR